MGFLYIFTGNGKGKTSAALGVSLRAAGHKKKVIFIQFMKGDRNTGEYKIRKNLLPYFEIYQFGREEFVDPEKPKHEDRTLALDALEFAERRAKELPFLIVLDELNVAVKYGLLRLAEVNSFLRKIPEDVNILITGRYAHKSLIEKADLVTEMKEIKHPYKKGEKARKGLEF